MQQPDVQLPVCKHSDFRLLSWCRANCKGILCTCHLCSAWCGCHCRMCLLLSTMLPVNTTQHIACRPPHLVHSHRRKQQHRLPRNSMRPTCHAIVIACSCLHGPSASGRCLKHSATNKHNEARGLRPCCTCTQRSVLLKQGLRSCAGTGEKGTRFVLQAGSYSNARAVHEPRVRPRRHHMILAWLKSISGCASMKRFSMACFCDSSLVGRPSAFWRWSYCGGRGGAGRLWECLASTVSGPCPVLSVCKCTIHNMQEQQHEACLPFLHPGMPAPLPCHPAQPPRGVVGAAPSSSPLCHVSPGPGHAAGCSLAPRRWCRWAGPRPSRSATNACPPPWSASAPRTRPLQGGGGGGGGGNEGRPACGEGGL